MDSVINLAGSIAGGGVFGLLGTALGRLASYFERRQTLQFDRLRWSHELKMRELENAAVLAGAEADRERLAAAGAWHGLHASIAADATIPSSYAWVDAIRALTRPLLTLLLWVISAMIWLSAGPDGQAAIIEATSFAAIAATLWWFGDRGSKPK